MDDRGEFVIQRWGLTWTPRPPHLDRLACGSDFEEIRQARDGSGSRGVLGLGRDYGLGGGRRRLGIDRLVIREVVEASDDVAKRQGRIVAIGVRVREGAGMSPKGKTTTVSSPQASFIFMVFHWTEPGEAGALADGMREMRDQLLAMPGCVAVEPPYLTDDGSCLVGISKWESEDAFRSSGITLRASDEIVPGETRPRERFLLREA